MAPSRTLVIGLFLVGAVAAPLTAPLSPDAAYPAETSTIEFAPIPTPATPPADPSVAVLQAEELLVNFIGKHPTTFAGHRISADGQRLTVFVADPAGPAIAEAQKLAGSLWPFVDLVDVEHSMQDLREATARIADTRNDSSNINAVGITPGQNTIAVYIDPGSDLDEASLAASEVTQRFTPEEVAALEASGLDRVLVGIEHGATTSDSRNADADWKNGAAGYNHGSNNSSS